MPDINYELIAWIYGAVALFTLAFICYKDFELIVTRRYPVITGYGGLLLAAIVCPLTWFLYLLSWVKSLGDQEEVDEAVGRRIRHGHRLRLGDETFKVYRVGKDIKLKFIAGLVQKNG